MRQIKMNEYEYERREHSRRQTDQWFKLFDWLKENHNDILTEGINAIQRG